MCGLAVVIDNIIICSMYLIINLLSRSYLVSYLQTVVLAEFCSVLNISLASN